MSINKIETTSSSYSTTLNPPARAQEFYEKALEILNPFGCENAIEDPANQTAVDQALVYLNEAIALDPTYPGFYVYKGLIELARSDFDAAIDDLSQAIELNPKFSDKDAPAGLAQFMRGAAYGLHQMEFNRAAMEKALADFQASADLGFEEANKVLPVIQFLLANHKEMKSAQLQLMQSVTTLLKAS